MLHIATVTSQLLDTMLKSRLHNSIKNHIHFLDHKYREHSHPPHATLDYIYIYIYHKTPNNVCRFSLSRLTLDLITSSLNVLPSCHHNAGSLKILSHSSVSDFKAPKRDCHPHTMQAFYKLERLLLLTS